MPIRTENDGDVVVKISDSLIPSQQLKVEADGSINVNAIATDLDIRDLVFATDKVDVSGSEVSLDAGTLAALENVTATIDNGAGAAAVNIQDGGNSITVDGTVELGATTLAALENITVSATDLDIRDLAFATDKVDVSGSSVTVSATDLDVRDLAFATDKVDVSGSDITATVTATDLDIRDLSHVSDSVKIGDGTDLLAVNTDGSINVVVQEDVGTEIVNYDTASAVAGGASSNHDYVFASASKLYQVMASASGKMKIEVQVETGAVTGVFNTIMVAFNSTANTNIDLTLAKYAFVPAGARVRVIRTNRDGQAQDVYSTIIGILG